MQLNEKNEKIKQLEEFIETYENKVRGLEEELASLFYTQNNQSQIVIDEKLKSPEKEHSEAQNRNQGSGSFLSPLNFARLGGSADEEHKDRDKSLGGCVISPQIFGNSLGGEEGDTLRDAGHLMPVKKYSAYDYKNSACRANPSSGPTTSVKTAFSESQQKGAKNSYSNSSANGNQVLD